MVLRERHLLVVSVQHRMEHQKALQESEHPPPPLSPSPSFLSSLSLFCLPLNPSIERGSPRKFGTRARRSGSVGAASLVPQQRLSITVPGALDVAWLTRHELKDTVLEAVKEAMQPNLSTVDDLRALVERYLVTTKFPEAVRARALQLASPLWGGPLRVINCLHERLEKLDERDRNFVGQAVQSSLLAWFQHDPLLASDQSCFDAAIAILNLVGDSATARRDLVALQESAAKVPPAKAAPQYPVSVFPDTHRHMGTPVTDLNHTELAEEIVAITWRLFAAIRTKEWGAYSRNWSTHWAGLEQRGTGSSQDCENVLALIQFTRSLQRWVKSSVAMVMEKQRVLCFWMDVADVCASSNCQHIVIAILDALKDLLEGDWNETVPGSGPLLKGWPDAFAGRAVGLWNTLIVWRSAVPKTLEPLVTRILTLTTPTPSHSPHGRTSLPAGRFPSTASPATPSSPSLKEKESRVKAHKDKDALSVSGNRDDLSERPVVPPLGVILAALDACLAVKRGHGPDLYCNLDCFVGVTSALQLIVNKVRSFGVPSQPVSPSMNELLLAMPLIPWSMMEAATRASSVSALRFGSAGSRFDEAVSAAASSRSQSSRSQSSRSHSDGSPGRFESPLPSPTGAAAGASTGTEDATVPGGFALPALPAASSTLRRLSRSSFSGKDGVTRESPTSQMFASRVGPVERSDLSATLSYRVRFGSTSSSTNSQKQIDLCRALGIVSDFILDDTGKIRATIDVVQEEEAADEAVTTTTCATDVVGFSIRRGTVRVSWVRGVSTLIMVLLGRSALGFHPGIVDDILFGWRLCFKQPSELLNRILKEFPGTQSEASLSYLSPRQVAELDSVRALRKRVLFVIKRWIEIESNSIPSLLEDSKFVELWSAFYAKLKESGGAAASAGKRNSRSFARSFSANSPMEASSLAAEEFMYASMIELIFLHNRPPRGPQGVPPSEDWSLLKWACSPSAATMAANLAEQLTALEQVAFSRVGVDELLGFPSHSNTSDRALYWLVQRFNRASSWVASAVVLEEELEARAQLIIFFMLLANEYLNHGNVMMSFAVFAGLESLPVMRLKKTWSRVEALDNKEGARSLFDKLKELFDPLSGQSNLRRYHERKAQKIVIPFLGLWTKDIFLIDRNNITFHPLKELATLKTVPSLRDSSPLHALFQAPNATTATALSTKGGDVDGEAEEDFDGDDEGASNLETEADSEEITGSVPPPGPTTSSFTAFSPLKRSLGAIMTVTAVSSRGEEVGESSGIGGGGSGGGGGVVGVGPLRRISSGSVSATSPKEKPGISPPGSRKVGSPKSSELLSGNMEEEPSSSSHPPSDEEKGVVPPTQSLCEIGDELEAKYSLLNFEKLNMVADNLSKVLFFQGKNAWNGGAPRMIMDPIAHTTALLDADALYTFSLRREPKAEQFENPLRAMVRQKSVAKV